MPAAIADDAKVKAARHTPNRAKSQRLTTSLLEKMKLCFSLLARVANRCQTGRSQTRTCFCAFNFRSRLLFILHTEQQESRLLTRALSLFNSCSMKGDLKTGPWLGLQVLQFPTNRETKSRSKFGILKVFLLDSRFRISNVIIRDDSESGMCEVCDFVQELSSSVDGAAGAARGASAAPAAAAAAADVVALRTARAT